MRLGYIRVSKASATEQEQRVALRKGDVDENRIYADLAMRRKQKPGDDQTPERTKLLRATRPGDVVVVSSAARLALSLPDGLDVLTALGKRGATLHIVSTGQTHEWTERDAANLELVRAMVTENRQEITAKARAEADRRRVGPKLEGKLLEKARAAWFDPKLTEIQVVEKIGIPGRTMRNKFGKRGTPVFGRVSKL